MKRFIIILMFWSCCISNIYAAVFYLPDDGDNIVGKLQHILSQENDTLVDIARKYNVGFNEITAANPHVDPWLPRENVHIVIPTQFILPKQPWQGIIINTAEMRLYFFPENQDKSHRRLVFTFPLGIGRSNWPTPMGQYTVIEKIKDPVWVVPETVLAEAFAEGHQMPKIIPAGEDNPLGKYAMVLNEPGYLIHGTNKPLSVGRRVSHGCLRLYPEDIEQLVKRVPRGAPVRIENETIKLGQFRNVLYIHPQTSTTKKEERNNLNTSLVKDIIALTNSPLTEQVWDHLSKLINMPIGVPVPFLGESHTQPSEKNASFSLELKLYKSNATDVLQRLNYFYFQLSPLNCSSGEQCLGIGPYPSTTMPLAIAELFNQGYGVKSRLISKSRQ